MKFRALQENLRRVLWRQIENGELTGLRLAELTGFRQAHISNFLNRKRGLSVEGMDKVLSVQHLSVLDLIDPGEVNKRASILPPSAGDFADVLLVEGPVAAASPVVMSMKVKEIVKFRKSFLRRLRPGKEGARSGWERFVAIRMDPRDGLSMYPRLLPGSTVLIDRHYNSLKPYRKDESNLYAVALNRSCTVRYVEVIGKNLILRPHNHAYRIEIVHMQEGKSASDYLVGRICHAAVET